VNVLLAQQAPTVIVQRVEPTWLTILIGAAVPIAVVIVGAVVAAKLTQSRWQADLGGSRAGGRAGAGRGWRG
jgi:hypothetical protein